MLSVNQINAQVKLTEMWKMSNTKNYPLTLKKLENFEGGISSRAMTYQDQD